MQGQTGRAFCTDSHPRQGQLEDLVIPLSRRKEKSECCQPGIFNQGVTNPITLPYPGAARWGVQANNTFFFPFDWFAHCESWGWEEESKGKPILAWLQYLLQQNWKGLFGTFLNFSKIKLKKGLKWKVGSVKEKQKVGKISAESTPIFLPMFLCSATIHSNQSGVMIMSISKSFVQE